MSQAIVAAVRGHYPTPLGAQHAAFLLDLASTLGGGAGLLKKDTGTFITLPDGTKVAQDIICYASGRIYDVLVDGEGSAQPSWNDAGTVDPARFYAVSADAPDPEPNPEPEPDVDLVALLTAINDRLAVIEQRLAVPVPVPLVQFPAYQGRIFGQLFTLRPVK